MLLQFDAAEVIVDGLMRRGLAGEDEAAAGIADGSDDRLAANRSSPRKTG
jgi:hypothetical protein